jgi:copper homeostasis protein (lipoprotein)
LVGIYTGTLPCADCSGILTELSLYARSRSQFNDATYKLTQTYLGTRDGDRAVKTAGRWTVLRGNNADPNATIYQLNFDRPQEILNFLRVSDQELKLLDRQQEEIKSQANLMLRRPQTPLLGGYGPADITDDRVREAAHFAVAEQGRRVNQTVHLQEISRAEQQIVAGINYRLCLKIQTSTGSRFAAAVIYRDLRGHHSLTDWTDGLC